MRLKEMLRGYQVDAENIQVVGNMTVVPLVSAQEFSARMGEVDEVHLNKDPDYGVLEFKNESGQVGIVMQGACIISKQPAQDRTVPRAQILKGKKTGSIGVFCVQSDQGGHFDAAGVRAERVEGEAPFKILPPTLRTLAVMRSKAEHDSSSYSRMWDDIKAYSQFALGQVNRAHLHDMYDKLKKELDEFVAQFEPVPNQLGAIVMINQEVVAVDIMPTHRSWRIMWRTFIRDSYGLEALRCISRGQVLPWGQKMNHDNVDSLDSLEAEMHRTQDVLRRAISRSWAGVHDQTVATQVMNNISGVQLMGLESGGYFGQAVMHDEHIVYMSLIPKNSDRQRVEAFKRRSQTYSNEEFGF
jgi:hypothetical protein